VRNLPAEVYQAIDQVAQKNSLDISRPQVVEDWQSESAMSSWATLAPIMVRFGIRASITVPLLAEGQRIDGLSVAASEPRRWSYEEIALAEAIGRQLGEAAERFRLLARVREQAQRMQ
jgi:GAF domain-containing protein